MEWFSIVWIWETGNDKINVAAVHIVVIPRSCVPWRYRNMWLTALQWIFEGLNGKSELMAYVILGHVAMAAYMSEPIADQYSNGSLNTSLTIEGCYWIMVGNGVVTDLQSSIRSCQYIDLVKSWSKWDFWLQFSSIPNNTFGSPWSISLNSLWISTLRQVLHALLTQCDNKKIIHS